MTTDNETNGSETTGDETTSVLTADTVGAVINRATFDEKGLLPAIVQQEDTGEVLMLGYMNAEALRRTLTEGRVTFWSRSRQEYWRKGDTSGHRQYVRAASLDCDGDTLLLKVIQIGPACHTGAHACFDVDPLTPRIGQPADWTAHE
jgi:phosphoribosyl-AMP cyclohydrolase